MTGFSGTFLVSFRGVLRTHHIRQNLVYGYDGMHLLCLESSFRIFVKSKREQFFGGLHIACALYAQKNFNGYNTTLYHPSFEQLEQRSYKL